MKKNEIIHQISKECSGKAASGKVPWNYCKGYSREKQQAVHQWKALDLIRRQIVCLVQLS